MACRLPTLAAAVLTAILTLPRHAQAQATPRDPFEVFGGYSYLRSPGNGVLAETSSDDVYALGWFAGAAYGVWRHVDLVAEAGGQYKSGATLEPAATFSFHTVLGGARGSVRWGRTMPFVEALAGGTHARATAFDTTVGATSLTLQGGGGIDYALTRHVAARAQIDYRQIRPSAGDSASQFRIAAGIVYR